MDSVERMVECLDEGDDADPKDRTNKSRLPPRFNCAIRNRRDEDQDDQ